VIRFRIPPATTAGDLPADLSGLTISDGMATLTSAEPTRALHTLTGWARAQDIELPGLTVTRPSLEDVYLQLAGPGASVEDS
jgi:ABC-2 type transport system ATP-binding protein